MRKLLIALLSIAFIASLAMAGSVTKTVTFGWTQEDTTNLKEWDLLWSDSSGGPYTSLVKIPYNTGDPAGDFQSPTEAIVTGDQATNVVKYFIMKACGDIPQADGTTVYKCSDPSNEVSASFWIPAGEFSVPVNFRVISQ